MSDKLLWEQNRQKQVKENSKNNNKRVRKTEREVLEKFCMYLCQVQNFQVIILFVITYA